MSYTRGNPFATSELGAFGRSNNAAAGFPQRKEPSTRFGRENGYHDGGRYSPARSFNRSPARQPARDSRQQSRQERSRLSATSEDSHLSAIINDAEIFPQELLFLLGEEQRNITAFKDRIEKEKARLDNDFGNFKREVEHIADDLRVSLQAELDNVYRFFIEKYASMKTEVQEVRRIRKEVEAQGRNLDFGGVGAATSNKELVRQLERDAEQYKVYRIQNYITQMQREKLTPLLELSKEIILLGTRNSSYYNPDNTVRQLNELKITIGHFTSHMFSSIGQYVTSPTVILEENAALADAKSEFGEDEDFQVPTKPGQTRIDEAQPRPVPQNNFPSSTMPAFRPNQDFIKPPAYQKPFERPTEKQYEDKPHSKVPVLVSQSQQIATTKWVEDLQLKPLATIRPDHSDRILCAIFVGGKFIVTGGKDSLLNVYSLDGAKITTLKGHQTSICSLAIINDPTEGQLLASGSDHGCSSLAVWSTNTWTMRMKVQAHTAAVTSILDLCDGQTLVSGSYDKQINVYDYRRNSLLYSLPNNKASVTGIILNSSRSRMVSCGLDNCLYVWAVSRNNRVESIALERTIQNNTMICSMSGSQLRSDVVVAGTKDGRVKFWNLSSGELEKTLGANNSAIIELVVVERQSKNSKAWTNIGNPIVLSCSSKDKNLVLTKTDTGQSSIFDVGDRLNVEYGCGIGPKIIFDDGKWGLMMGLVSQVPERKEVNLFQVELK